MDNEQERSTLALPACGQDYSSTSRVLLKK